MENNIHIHIHINNNLTTKILGNLTNFNLIKIIFSYLNTDDLKEIYWINKQLRPLISYSLELIIRLKKLMKCSSYNSKNHILFLLELTNGEISCFTTKGIELLKIEKKNLELIKYLPLEVSDLTPPIQQENGNIIYGRENELLICDNNFNIIEKFEESNTISSLCNLSDLSFAVGLLNGTLKIYSKNLLTYQIKPSKSHAGGIGSLLYLPKINYLLSGSWDKTINVFDLSEKKTFRRLTGHNYGVTSLISLNEETFASCCSREIKIWSIRIDNNTKKIMYIEAIKSIVGNTLSLHSLGKDLMLCRRDYDLEIWDMKNYNFKCLNSYKEDKAIETLIVTKSGYVITGTQDKKVNVWNILI
jgi:WD40 repeat protein